MKKWVLIVAPIILVLALGGAWLGFRSRKSAGNRAAYELSTIARGSIESIVASSGTLAPISTVSVISQMSGRVEKVFADYNDRVRKGMVLASLNTEMLRLQEQGNRSAVKKARAQYELQLIDVQNKTKLAEKGLVSDYDFKSSKAGLEVLAADLAAAESALEVVQTEITQYAFITSPINGIVLDRNVEEGQSVVDGASSNSASLFTLAEDLARMEIKAEVDELDISSIKVGQEVRFTVEAWPGLNLQRPGAPDPARAEDHGQCGQLLRHGRGKQPGGQAPAGHDRDRAIHQGKEKRHPGCAQCGPALPAPGSYHRGDSEG